MKTKEERVNQEYPIYNLGDLVEVVGTTNIALNGKVGMIRVLPTKELHYYKVVFDNDYCYLTAKNLVPYAKLAVNPKIKEGDKVRTLSSPKDVTGIVKKICDNGLIGVLIEGEGDLTVYYAPSDLEVVQTKEQMEGACLRQWQSELEELNKMELDKMQHPEEQYTYEAQLAHDIAVKLVGGDVRSPQEIGDYAVAVAKAVVEGLKKK